MNGKAIKLIKGLCCLGLPLKAAAEGRLWEQFKNIRKNQLLQQNSHRSSISLLSFEVYGGDWEKWAAKGCRRFLLILVEAYKPGEYEEGQKQIATGWRHPHSGRGKASQDRNWQDLSSICETEVKRQLSSLEGLIEIQAQENKQYFKGEEARANTETGCSWAGGRAAEADLTVDSWFCFIGFKSA